MGSASHGWCSRVMSTFFSSGSGTAIRPDGMALLARPTPETSLKRTSQHLLRATPEGRRKLEAWRDRLHSALASFPFHEDLRDALELAHKSFEAREQELLLA